MFRAVQFLNSPRQRYSWGLGLIFILLIIPLAFVPILPLADLPGHMGRYAIQANISTSPFLRLWYDYEWSLIANLGVDLPVYLLSGWLGVELATKLVVMTIPPTLAAGFLWVSRETHGNIPPTALFALPLAYNYPFFFGFVNFSFAMAWMMVAYALWLRLGHQGDRGIRLRAKVFLVIAPALWVMHVYGWAALCLVCLASEFARRMDWSLGGLRPILLSKTVLESAWVCLPLSVPLVLMVAWRGDTPMELSGWFDFLAKAKWVVGLFRDRWLGFDMIFTVTIFALIALPLVFRRQFKFNPSLACATLALGLVVLVLPRNIFASWFADVRLVPYSVALAVLAIAPRNQWPVRWTRAIIVLGLAFLAVRSVGLTASTALYAKSYAAELEAIDFIEDGGRVAVFTEPPCGLSWYHPRLAKLPGLAIVRRHAFTNDQYAAEGAQALRVTYKAAGPFQREPSSQVVHDPRCGISYLRTLEQSLAILPWAAFDYVWLLDVPEKHWPMSDGRLQELWRNEGSILFQIIPLDGQMTNETSDVGVSD